MNKLLIANRGEIAVRIIRSAKAMGYRTVAVYSEADAGAPHVRLADEAVLIGPASVQESYLSSDTIIAAARLAGADAIHPGYGFLSENAAFAQACADAGLCFVGPGAAAIELMGSKRQSKIAMLAAGVPCIPGYEGAAQDDETLCREAQRIGFPVMIKASAGGGGRGMRLANDPAEFASQLKSARSEALSAFGSDELILEKALVHARHIEIQVFADSHGNYVYLGERDCSVQRRHQKVIEEAPSPAVSESLRRAMGEAAVNAARACDYRGAGTVEFLLDADGRFYFLEMNTRLQVEHPVTEMVTGQDLVEWQLRVAEGEPLPLQQHEIVIQGHAIEVRLYAEDPRQGFLPQAGLVAHWSTPQGDDIRVDSGIASGQRVSSHYDPMLAKVIARGRDRGEAIRRLRCALLDTRLLGLHHNKAFLQNILNHPVFVQGQATTDFIAREFAADSSLTLTRPPAFHLALAASLFSQAQHQSEGLGRRNVSYTCRLACEGETYPVQLWVEGRQLLARVDDQVLQLQLHAVDESVVDISVDRLRRRVACSRSGAQVFLDDESGHFVFDDVTQLAAVASAAGGDGQVKASMDGLLIDLCIAEGQPVRAGQTVAVIEAMKMEHPLKANIDGIVDSVSCEVGQQVKSKQLLVSIRTEDAA